MSALYLAICTMLGSQCPLCEALDTVPCCPPFSEVQGGTSGSPRLLRDSLQVLQDSFAFFRAPACQWDALETAPLLSLSVADRGSHSLML